MRQILFERGGQVVTEGHSSKGNQPKWFVDEKWYKADHMGYEGLAEVLVSRLLLLSNAKDFISYEPVQITYDGKTASGSTSPNFLKQDEILIPFERLHRSFRGRGLAQTIAQMETAEKVRYTVELIEGVTGLQDVGQYLTMILELDSFFLNEDRHTNNLSVIRNEKTGKYRLSPIYDNGLSLLSDLHDYPLEQDIYSMIARVQAKPFDRDFDLQTETAEILFRPQLKFSFTAREAAGELDALTEYYPKEIIDRVECIVLEQIRKYPVFFSNA